MPDKVMFTKSISILPVFKGVYKDETLDFDHFTVLVKRCRKETGDPVADNIGNSSATAGEESQIVFGWANVTLNEDGTIPEDYQSDAIETDELEAAAYNFVLNKGMANQEHKYGTECGYLVESMMFTKEKMHALNIPPETIPEGWFVGFYIPDRDVFEKVKDGTYNMFSIEGKARRIATSDNY